MSTVKQNVPLSVSQSQMSSDPEKSTVFLLIYIPFLTLQGRVLTCICKCSHKTVFTGNSFRKCSGAHAVIFFIQSCQLLMQCHLRDQQFYLWFIQLPSFFEIKVISSISRPWPFFQSFSCESSNFKGAQHFCSLYVAWSNGEQTLFSFRLLQMCNRWRNYIFRMSIPLRWHCGSE